MWRKKTNRKKKKRVKEALLSGGCDTVLSNKTKRYLTIAFTVLEEICFSLPTQEKKKKERAQYPVVKTAETETKGKIARGLGSAR